MDGGVVFVPGVPGLPPGAFWTGDGTDPLFTGPAQHDAQLDPCSGDALLNSSAHHQKLHARPGGPGHLQRAEARQGKVGRMPSLAV